MAQKTKSNKGRRAPAYSADSLAVHLLLGLILIALGLLIVLAVILNVPGAVFGGVRQVSRGLAGSLAFLLPVLPIWGGVLVLTSMQRRPRLFSFVMACLMVLMLLTTAVLLTYSGNPAMPLMDYIHQHSRSSAYDMFLARGYVIGAENGMAGGLLGMLLAWPLWKTVGVIPGVAVSIISVIFSCMMMLHLTPSRIRELLGKFNASRQQRSDRRQQEMVQQELAWQRQQAAMAQQPQQPWYPPQQPVYSNQPTQTYAPPQQVQQQAMWYPPERPAEPEQPLPSQMLEPERSPYAPPMPQEKKKPRKARKPAAPRDVIEEEIKPRRSGIFTDQTAVEEEPRFRRSSIFTQTEDTPRAAAPVYQEPAAPPQEPAFRREEPEERWESTSRIPSWRHEPEEETAYTPRPAPVKPKVREQPSVEAEKPRQVQKPKASWADTPPWEDDPDAPIAPEEAVSPVLQSPQPSGAWKPELKIPPRREKPVEVQTEMELPPPYVYPSLSLLKQPEPQQGISPEEDAIRSQRLEETLQSFRVPAKVRHITHGPAISRFELELAAGIKVSKVTDLNRNIAMNMEVKSVRIEAPIPGKSLVGVEVPNAKTATVTLREVLESDPMRTDKPLVVALGKDIAGTPIVCDLARMPHLLIAGATGSGKSVCINTIINSLLYRRSPREVRLILVDPKVVELKCYDGIPHLLIPVVSDPHKASGALGWAVGEMMDRYKKFEHKGVRAIDSYNAALEADEEFMPRIVIIIDELADLMMVCKKEVEEHICRIAQLARAAGIHLVVATQRPSVDVITGLIKANIPSRIAFKVSSAVDSRTILDKIGAEQLLGYGDMLYQPTGEFTPIRVQGCFLSDAEVNRITDFIRDTCPASYDAKVLEQLDQLAHESTAAAAPQEPVDMGVSDGNLLMQCIEMAVNEGQVSTSHIQRRLKLGYARAGRLVDEMESRGVVSAKDGAKPRLCLISREEFEEMKASGAFNDA